MALMLVAVGVLSAGVLIVYLSGAFRRSSGPSRNIVPVLDGWWGRGKKPEEEEDAAIREFKLEISAEELEDLNGENPSYSSMYLFVLLNHRGVLLTRLES